MNPFNDQQAAPATGRAWGATATVSTAINADASRLAQKEADLQQREAAIRQMELELKSAAGKTQGARNWPSCCPVLHIDIAGDIPADKRGMVRCAYWAFLGILLCLVFNLVGTIAVMIACGGDHLSSFLWAALYLVGGAPGALFLWFKGLYRASISDGAFGYAFFFAFFLAHLIFAGWSAVAPPVLNSWSHTGFWAAKDIMPQNHGVGTIYYIGSGLWALEWLWSMYTLKAVYSGFRGKKQGRAVNDTAV